MLAFSPDYPTRQRTTSEKHASPSPNHPLQVKAKQTKSQLSSKFLDKRKGYDEACKRIYALHDLMGKAFQPCVDLKATTFLIRFLGAYSDPILCGSFCEISETRLAVPLNSASLAPRELAL